MNENLENARKDFLRDRESIAGSLSAEHVVRGRNPQSSLKAGAARNTFSYERSMAEVAIGKALLEGNSLKTSVAYVVEQHSEIDSTLTV